MFPERELQRERKAVDLTTKTEQSSKERVIDPELEGLD